MEATRLMSEPIGLIAQLPFKAHLRHPSWLEPAIHLRETMRRRFGELDPGSSQHDEGLLLRASTVTDKHQVYLWRCASHWWAWSDDLNIRPHAYQACALTN